MYAIGTKVSGHTIERVAAHQRWPAIKRGSTIHVDLQLLFTYIIYNWVQVVHKITL